MPKPPLVAATSTLPVYPSPQTHTKLGIKILPASTLFVAGAKLAGKLEIDVKTDKLALGELGIELAAFQELRSSNHTSTRRLFVRTILFQDVDLPPSNAIVARSFPLSGHFYPALKGRTQFPFSFDLSSKLPSSCTLGGNATMRYELRAFSRSLWEGEVHVKSEKREVKVVEKWGDWEEQEGKEPKWRKGAERKAEETLRLGGEGRLELEARVGCEQDGGYGRLFWRRMDGEGREGHRRMEVRVRVKNGTKKTVSGLKMTLCRRLRVIPPENSPPVAAPLVTAPVATESYRGIGFEFASGDQREVMIAMEVPADECWTMRKGMLFELDVFLKVEVECGFLAKDLAVELPIWIAHPLSLPPAAHAAFSARHGVHAHPPAVLIPGPVSTYPGFPRTRHQSMPSHLASAGAYSHSYPAPAAPDVYNEFGGFPSNPTPLTFADHHPQSHSYSTPQPHPQYQYAPFPASPASAFSQHPPYPPQQQQQQAPIPQFAAAPPYASQHSLSRYPSSPNLAGVAAFHQHGTPYVAFDPNTPELTPSTFLGHVAQHPPQVAYAPTPYSHPPQPFSAPAPAPAPAPVPCPTSPAPLPSTASPYAPPIQRAHSPHLLDPSPAPAFYQPHSPSRSQSPIDPVERPLSARGFRQAELELHASSESPPPPVIFTDHEEQKRFENNVAPFQPYSGVQRAETGDGDGRIVVQQRRPGPEVVGSMAQQPQPQSQAQLVSQGEVNTTGSVQKDLRKSKSAGSMRGLGRTPPPSPSTLARRGPSPLARTEVEDATLETIGEDGESQAGTIPRNFDLEHAKAELSTVESVQADSNSPGRSSVEALEEWAEDHAHEKEVGGELDKIRFEKTLPGPPVPTGRTKPGGAKAMRAQDIFSGGSALDSATSTSEESSTASSAGISPFPSSSSATTLSSSASSTPSSPHKLKSTLPPRDSNGLSALLSRLSRPSSPSPSTSTSTSSLSTLATPASPTRPPTTAKSMRSTGTGTGTGSGALRAKSISRASREMEVVRRLAEEDPKEAVRRVREGQEEEIRREAERELERGREREREREAEEQKEKERRRGEEERKEKERRREEEKKEKEEEEEKEEKEREVRFAKPVKKHEKREVVVEEEKIIIIDRIRSFQTTTEDTSSESGAGSTLIERRPRTKSTPSIPATRQLPPQPVVNGRKVVDVGEVKALQNDAVSRVSNWLRDESVEATPKVAEPTPTPVKIRRSTYDFGRLAPTPPPHSQATISSSASTASLSSRAGSPIVFKRPSESTLKKEPTVAQLLEAESRAELKALKSDRPTPSVVKTRELTPAVDENLKIPERGADEPKYDVRSARGGRGGVVSSVANQWKERIEGEAVRTKSPPPMVSSSVKAHKSTFTPLPSHPVQSVHVHKEHHHHQHQQHQQHHQHHRQPPHERPASPVKEPTSCFNSPPIKPASSSPSKPTSATVPTRPGFGKDWKSPSPAKPFLNTTIGKPPVLLQGPKASSAANSAYPPPPLVNDVPVTKAVREIIAKWPPSS